VAFVEEFHCIESCMAIINVGCYLPRMFE